MEKKISFKSSFQSAKANVTLLDTFVASSSWIGSNTSRSGRSNCWIYVSCIAST